MKIKNIIYSASVATVLAFGLSACSDSYLDETMFSNYGTDVTDVNAKVIGLHYKYAALWGMSSRQGFTGIWQDGTDVGAPGDTEGVEVPFFQSDRGVLHGIQGFRCLPGIFAILGPAILLVSAFLTAGYLFPIVVDAFFPGNDFESEKGFAEPGFLVNGAMIALCIVALLAGLFGVRVVGGIAF